MTLPTSTVLWERKAITSDSIPYQSEERSNERLQRLYTLLEERELEQPLLIEVRIGIFPSLAIQQ